MVPLFLMLNVTWPAGALVASASILNSVSVTFTVVPPPPPPAPEATLVAVLVAELLPVPLHAASATTRMIEPSVRAAARVI
jgi:hypothetical protein